MESFQTVWKVLGQSGEFLNGQESFQAVWKVSGQSGNFPDGLESFQLVWKVSSWSEKFPGSLEFFDSVESFWTVYKVPKIQKKEQARKPRSYASPKLCPPAYSLTGVKCRATSVAKNHHIFYFILYLILSYQIKS